MTLTDELWPWLASYIPALLTAVVSGAGLWVADRLLLRRARYLDSGGRFSRQVVMLLLTAAALLAVVVALPIAPQTRGQVLSLLGVVLTAIIALSSTTFVSNAMAGLMLRSMGNIRIGDFVRISDQFGRVTERGLFHTEIQTEDRDLTTIPNLYLVSNPMTVVRSSGTIISCTVSLGYDTSHQRIQALLREAGAAAGLEDCFVQILELGDFSVGYRVAGFLAEVGHLLTARTRLRAAVLDTLHGAGVEIMSPGYMAQRPVAPDARVLPPEEPAAPAPEAPITAEEVVFDKAAEAESLERLRQAHAALAAEIGDLEREVERADEARRAALERDLDARRGRLAGMEADLASAEEPAKPAP